MVLSIECYTLLYTCACNLFVCIYRDLSYGKGSTAPVAGAKLPDISTTEPWDGKDGEYPQEEDYGDLDDIELEPLDNKKKEEL